MTADLFSGEHRIEGNDMAGPAGAGPNRWHPGGADPSFPGQPMPQQVIIPCMVYADYVHKVACCNTSKSSIYMVQRQPVYAQRQSLRRKASHDWALVHVCASVVNCAV